MKYSPSQQNGDTLHVKVGAFVCLDTLGIRQITDVGFKPKRVSFHVSWVPEGETRIYCCTGVMDENGNQNSMSWTDIGNRSAGSSVEKAIYLRGISATSIEATYVSMDEDGFTLDFTFSDSRFLVRWEAIG